MQIYGTNTWSPISIPSVCGNHNVLVGKIKGAISLVVEHEDIKICSTSMHTELLIKLTKVNNDPCPLNYNKLFLKVYRSYRILNVLELYLTFELSKPNKTNTKWSTVIGISFKIGDQFNLGFHSKENSHSMLKEDNNMTTTIVNFTYTAQGTTAICYLSLYANNIDIFIQNNSFNNLEVIVKSLTKVNWLTTTNYHCLKIHI